MTDAGRAQGSRVVSLQTVIEAARRLDELSCARAIGNAAEAVHAAQRGGQPLAALTPSAVRLTADGGVALDSAAPFGSAVGYTAPERLRGNPGDRRADVFALGVVLWEALAHEALFVGPSDEAIKKAVLGDAFRPPSELNANVPAELDAICKKALARDPVDRYQSAKVMAAELDAVLSDAGYPETNEAIAAWVAQVETTTTAPGVAAPAAAAAPVAAAPVVMATPQQTPIAVVTKPQVRTAPLPVMALKPITDVSPRSLTAGWDTVEPSQPSAAVAPMPAPASTPSPEPAVARTKSGTLPPPATLSPPRSEPAPLSHKREMPIPLVHGKTELPPASSALGASATISDAMTDAPSAGPMLPESAWRLQNHAAIADDAKPATSNPVIVPTSPIAIVPLSATGESAGQPRWSSMPGAKTQLLGSLGPLPPKPEPAPTPSTPEPAAPTPQPPEPAPSVAAPAPVAPAPAAPLSLAERLARAGVSAQSNPHATLLGPQGAPPPSAAAPAPRPNLHATQLGPHGVDAPIAVPEVTRLEHGDLASAVNAHVAPAVLPPGVSTAPPEMPPPLEPSASSTSPAPSTSALASGLSIEVLPSPAMTAKYPTLPPSPAVAAPVSAPFAAPVSAPFAVSAPVSAPIATAETVDTPHLDARRLAAPPASNLLAVPAPQLGMPPGMTVAPASPGVAIKSTEPHDDRAAADFSPRGPGESPRAATTGGRDVLAGWGWSTGATEAIDDEDFHDTARASRKRLLLAIGGAIAVVAVIVVAALAFSGGHETTASTTPSPTAPSTTAPSATAPSATTPPAPTAPVAAPTEAPTAPAPAPTEVPAAPAPAPTEAAPTPAAPQAATPPAPTPPPADKPSSIVDAPVIVAPLPEPAKPEPKKPEPKKPEPKKLEPKKPEPAKVATKPARRPTTSLPVPAADRAAQPIDPYASSAPDPASAYKTGLQQFARGDTAGALATFRASASASPSFAPTWRGLGLVYEKMGNKGQARSAFKRYLQLSPSAEDAEQIRARLERLGS